MGSPIKTSGKATGATASAASAACPCGAGSYAGCCARYIEGTLPAPTAEALMRSRYTAYVLRNEAYLRATWWPDTLPEESLTGADDVKWIGLAIAKPAKTETHDSQKDETSVEFTARFKVGGRAHKLHEISLFRRQADTAGALRWYYVDGTFPDDDSPAQSKK